MHWILVVLMVHSGAAKAPIPEMKASMEFSSQTECSERAQELVKTKQQWLEPGYDASVTCYELSKDGTTVRSFKSYK